MAYDGVPQLPQIGGTGTTTQFTQGSVVYAGANGVYSQNNSGLFWDNTNTRFGLSTTSPGSTLSVNGNFSIGATAKSNAAPTSGLLVEGRSLFGNTSGSANGTLSVSISSLSSTGTNSILNVGNNETVTLNNAYVVNTIGYVGGTYTAANNKTTFYGFGVGPAVNPNAGITLTNQWQIFTQPVSATTTGTITNQAALCVFSANITAIGLTVTNCYGIYCKNPGLGTNQIAAYLENLSVGAGNITTVPPTNGARIQGSIRNDALTASTALVADANKNITSVTTVNSAVLSTSNTGVISFSTTPTVTSMTFGSGTALNTFVEGTFSPTLLGSTGGSGATYYNQYGYYQKINNRVYIIIALQTNSKGTLTGNIQIGNLPYTSGNLTGTASRVNFTVDNVTFTAGYTYAGLEIISNSTTCNVLQFGSAKDGAYVDMTNLGSGNGRFFGSFSYTTTA